MTVDLAGFKERHTKGALGRNDLAAEVSHRIALSGGREVSKRQMLVILDEVFGAMSDALQAGKRVEIRGFGTMHPHRVNARRLVSPMTKGKAVRVDARWKVVFKTSKQLKRALMASLEE